MTGRELILAILQSTDDLDMDIPIRIVHRDVQGGVTHRQSIETIYFINGKMSIEGIGIGKMEPVL